MSDLISKAAYSHAKSIASIIRNGMSDTDIQAVLDLGGAIKIIENIAPTVDLTLTKKTYLYSENNAKIEFQNSKKLIINDQSKVEGLYISTISSGMDNSLGIITINAKSEIVNCEVDGKVTITASTSTNIGGHGIAMGPLASGTIIKGNYIHNTSNSFIEAYHNNTAINRPQIPNLTIENNVLTDSETGDAIALNTSNSSIKYNRLSGKWENGMLAHPAHVGGVKCTNVIFEGNYIDCNTAYQATKIGFGIALRYSDDLVTGCENCIIKGNTIVGWGGSVNGVEAIRVDQYCSNNLVENNIVGGDNTPTNGVFIRIRGDNTKVIGNYCYAIRGARCIHLVYGTSFLERNIVMVTGTTYPITIDATVTYTTLVYNTFESTTSNNACVELTTPCRFENNTVKCVNGYALTTSAAASNLDIISNKVTSDNTIGMYINASDVNISNNRIVGGSDVVYISALSTRCRLYNNIISVNAASAAKRDSILINGTGHSIIANKIESSGRNSIQTTTNCVGDITISNNEVVGGAGTFYMVGNANYTLYIMNNSFNGITLNSTYAAGKTVLKDNSNYTLTDVANHVLVENGFGRQSVIPGAGGAADIFGANLDFVRKEKVTVVTTNETPNGEYRLLSDSTWKKIA